MTDQNNLPDPLQTPELPADTGHTLPLDTGHNLPASTPEQGDLSFGSEEAVVHEAEEEENK